MLTYSLCRKRSSIVEKLVVSVLGQDRPGIVASVSNILYAHDCNIEDVTQTILQSEFAAILLVNCPGTCSADLEKDLVNACEPLGLSVLIRPAAHAVRGEAVATEPLVVTTSGPDCSGQVARVSAVIKEFDANITELKAVKQMDADSAVFIMIFEINFPLASDSSLFRSRLGEVCSELEMKYSVQHREIFEAINRI